ncbi:phosphoadenosine phosphosulfate reductase [Saccharopolyspora erythraea NRRL 2338]|uniref:Adenosine 5'-phosphosulfate reductase n=2 Tax=Saccharopolyspora erythraea TaxID=1836 RepID=A4F9S2_SACEN|nr:phosphoadenylyl-sulfate reductase [Saccharopolyspora erythraea]EQD83392.1 phosphoadenosine phosphosulfate reductase [Saccharopolyspora erythraea D]PFG94584.1 phosphoadenosine phosphosulfate reductase [Saccharopolyspora erythraea NRRL 2338]QRK91323.1 phosphoadenylyl-sulfate reductase [Saccharopolyspora erythraea]CAM00797.1 phosphoadenosine phosphosulfate reductase [Saccharopolyspora erythraea NRRL 2338]
MTAETTTNVGVRRSDEELRALAEEAAPRLAEATAEEALRWAADTFGENLIVASNMQDAVLVDLAAKASPGVDVLFLETGYHFAETIGTRDAVAQVYDVSIVNAVPEQSVAEQDAGEGPNLFERDPNRCCFLRKVVPLRNTLARYEAWVTGVRRVEAPTRANTPVVTWDDRNGLVKINPLAAWSDEEMDAYIAEHGVLVNPLVPAGYPSIGCRPCTAKPAPGADPRSGRWAGNSKTECGLHG